MAFKASLPLLILSTRSSRGGFPQTAFFSESKSYVLLPRLPEVGFFLNCFSDRAIRLLYFLSSRCRAAAHSSRLSSFHYGPTFQYPLSSWTSDKPLDSIRIATRTAAPAGPRRHRKASSLYPTRSLAAWVDSRSAAAAELASRELVSLPGSRVQDHVSYNDMLCRFYLIIVTFFILLNLNTLSAFRRWQ